MGIRILFFVLLGMFFGAPAYAAPPTCNAAAEGTIVYNKDFKMMQYCNATQWIGMAGSSSGGGSSVWVDGGAGKIYYSGGAVGIGGNVTDPVAVLQVTGGAKFSTDLTLGGQVIVDAGGGNETRIQANPAGISNFKGAVQASTQLVIDDAGNQTRFQAVPAGVSTMSGGLTVTGKVGIGNTGPQTKLDVTGSIKVGDGSEPCNAAVHEGAIRYVAATKKTQMCRNSATGWEDIGTGSGAGITALTGDVTASGTGSVAATIANNAVTNAKAAQMAANTIKGNNTGATANAADLTAAQATAMLSAMVGDSGSGGTKGLVPAPATGDAAAGKYLKADGTWATVPAGAETDPQVGTTTANNFCRANAGGTAIDCATTAVSLATQVTGNLPVANLNSGTAASATTFWRGDGTWATPASGADNLGNHTATTTLAMGANAITGTGLFTGGRLAASGSTSNDLISVRPGDDLNPTYAAIVVGNAAWSAWPFSVSKAGNVTATSYTGSGSGLTALNASSLASGTVPTARLGSGTASATTYLRGDGTWATPSGGGTAPQGTTCGRAIVQYTWGNVRYYGCGSLFQWGGTSQYTCQGMDISANGTTCPSGYTAYVYNDGQVVEGGYNVEAEMVCAKTCVKN